ncbi:hypothetical protein D3C81_1209590 [compost metagenome]
MQGFWISSRLGEAFAAGPFEQPMEKGAWARTPRKTVNPGPYGQGFNFVFLLQIGFQRGRWLKADTRLCSHQDIAVSNGQGRVTGNPPVRRQLVQRAQCWPHQRWYWRRMHIVGRHRRCAHCNVRAAAGQGLEHTGQLRRCDRLLTRQHVAQTGFVQIRRCASCPGALRRHTDPGGVTGTGQSDVKQAHFFAHALIVGKHLCRFCLIPLDQFNHQTLVVMEHRRRGASAIDGSGTTGKRQQHQRVFQPFGLVHGDDLD